MKVTILGGRGFIGQALRARFVESGHDVAVPGRDANLANGENLGHVIYAIGLTADFRTRPFETIEAHVAVLSRILAGTAFDSWTYLSSTRVYAGLGDGPVDEQATLRVFPDADGLYNLSKLSGEALCLAQQRPEIRVARLSNVFGQGMGKDSFLGSLLDDHAYGRPMTIGEAAQSSKDYVAIEDVCQMVEQIAIRGRARLYNVAGGVPVTHAAIAHELGKLTSQSVTFACGGQCRSFPAIDITRIVNEFDFRPRPLIQNLSRLVRDDRELN